jgi:hypothetical protein
MASFFPALKPPFPYYCSNFGSISPENTVDPKVFKGRLLGYLETSNIWAALRSHKPSFKNRCCNALRCLNRVTLPFEEEFLIPLRVGHVKTAQPFFDAGGTWTRILNPLVPLWLLPCGITTKLFLKSILDSGFIKKSGFMATGRLQ